MWEKIIINHDANTTVDINEIKENMLVGNVKMWEIFNLNKQGLISHQDLTDLIKTAGKNALCQNIIGDI